MRGEIQGWNARGPTPTSRSPTTTPTPRRSSTWRSSPPAATACARCSSATGSRLGDGIKVRIYGYLDFYAPRGQLKLVMTGIDPRFTLGDLAQQRDQVLRRLVAGGLVDANRRPPLGRVPLRIGVVTSVGSAAWHDFHHELDAQRSRLPARGLRRARPGRPRRGDGRRGRSTSLGRPPARRHRGHPRRRRPQRAVRVRRRGDRPRHRRLAGAGAHRPRPRDRPQHRRRGRPHLVQDAHRVRARRSSQAAASTSPTAERAFERVVAAARDDARRGPSIVLVDRAHRIARRTHAAVVRAEEGLGQRRRSAARGPPAGRSATPSAASTAPIERLRSPAAAASSTAEAAPPRRRSPRRARCARPRRRCSPAGWTITRDADGAVVRSPLDVAAGDVLVTEFAAGTVTSTVDGRRSHRHGAGPMTDEPHRP